MKEQVFKRGILNTYIIGAVPSYQLLDSITSDKDELFLFIDFNNNVKGLYYPKMLEMILNEIKANDGKFPSILINEWMLLQNYFEEYKESRSNIKKLHVIYFSEGGESYYHKSLYKFYKSTRKSALFQLPISIVNDYKSYDDVGELMRAFLLSTWKWIEVFSQRSNILSIRLENLDADFIPELLLRKFNIYKDNASYLILSSDGDMLQTLDIADNVYIYDSNINNIITSKTWINSKRYLDVNKRTNESNDIDILQETDITPDKIILFKAIVGDTSDHIPGIKGIGVKRFFNSFINEIPNSIRADDIDSIIKFCNERKSDNKICNKIANNSDEFIKMVKLVSFKMLIEWLLQNTIRYHDIKKIIDNNYNALVESCNFKKLQKQSQADNMLNTKN